MGLMLKLVQKLDQFSVRAASHGRFSRNENVKLLELRIIHVECETALVPIDSYERDTKEMCHSDSRMQVIWHVTSLPMADCLCACTHRKLI